MEMELIRTVIDSQSEIVKFIVTGANLEKGIIYVDLKFSNSLKISQKSVKIFYIKDLGT
jgi:hypothetical protein